MTKHEFDMRIHDARNVVGDAMVLILASLIWTVIYVIYFMCGVKIMVAKEFTWEEQMNWNGK